MPGVLGLRTRAAWRRRWPSLLATALLVAVAFAVTVTAVSGARRTHSSPARFLHEDGTADVFVALGGEGALHSLRGVHEIAGLPQVAGVSINAGMAAFPTTGYAVLLAPIDGSAGITAARGLLLAGRRPDPLATDEVLLSESHAKTLHMHVGDRIPLAAFDDAQAKRCLYPEETPPDCGKLFETPRFSIRVVGIARTAGDVNNRSTDVGISVLSGRFFERHRSDIAWSPSIAVRLRAGASAESFITAARKFVPDGVDGEFDLVNANASFDAVNVLTTGLMLFALVAGIAGAFAVGQAIVREVRAHDEERALLATFGASSRSLLADALGPIVPAAVLGIVVALAAVYLASDRMPIGFARRVDPSLGRQFDWLVVAVGIAITFAVVVGAATVAWRSSLRRPAGAAAPGALPALVSRAAVSPAAAVGIRHACSPGRGRRAVPIRSALVGVAAATAGIVGVLGFSAGLAHLVDTPRLYGWTFDVTGVDTAYASRVIADPGVSAVSDLHSAVPVRVNDRPAFGQVVAPIAGDIGPAIVAGRAPVARDEIALGADTLHAARVHIGGTVAVAGPVGKLAMRVVGQAVFPTGSDAYPLADGAVFTPSALRVFGEGDSSHSLAIRYRPGTNRGATYARLDALDAKSHSEASAPEEAAPPAEIEKLRQVQSLPNVLAGFLALLGVIAVAHVLIVGVRRRARDFAVLRALGFRRRDVRAAVAWEAGALALAGAAIGIPIGIVIARLAWTRTAHGIGVMAVPRLPRGVLAIVPIAVALAIVLALVPARRAARLRPAEILRSE